MMKVAPSILSLDYTNFPTQVEQLNASKASYIHFDVMDGHFVPNLSFGPDILKAFVKTSKLVKDVHLMVNDPVYFADVFIDAGADIATFHYEALSDKEKIIALAEHIHERGKKAGLSIKPATDVKVIEPLLEHFDLFLIMSVEPGFGGQSFMMNALEKIAWLRKQIDAKKLDAEIEVDGGIQNETAELCKEAGVDVLVAGSYIFKHDIQSAVDSLL